jgi:peptidylprolyl isomerase
LTAKSNFKYAAIVTSALLLAGCSNAVVPTGEYAETVGGITPTCETYASGDAVKLVRADGEFNTQPEVSFPFPLEGSGMETNVIIDGNGGPIVGSQRVGMHFAGYNASTGEQFQASEFGGPDFIYQDLIPGNSPDFCAALTGVQLGSRVAVLLSPENVHQGEGIPNLGLGPNDGVVFVFDIVKAFLPKANGLSRSAEAGMPTVILAPSGQPGIQIPKSEPPSQFKRTILIEGKGSKIAIGDNVTLHYTGWTWLGEEFDSSWPRQAPASFDVSPDGLIEGFVQALDGVTIGSQIIAVIPPELGYGDSGQGSIPPGSTLIFVIDVLGKE